MSEIQIGDTRIDIRGSTVVRIEEYARQRKFDVSGKDETVIIQCKLGEFIDLLKGLTMRMLAWNQFMVCMELCSILEDIRLMIVCGSPEKLDETVSVYLHKEVRV